VEITVKYLSVLKDKAGTAKEVFAMPANSALSDLTGLIESKRGIHLPDPHVMMVLNGKGFNQYPEKLQTKLNAGDTLLLLPPVSGG
jgi:molybdopterin converting factor small subunit